MPGKTGQASPQPVFLVLVVGAGHSAANTRLALAELAGQAPTTQVTWAIRATGPARTYGGETAGALTGPGGSRHPVARTPRSRRRLDLITGFSVHQLAPAPGAGVAALAGDWTAARDVQLDLPETGVCNSTPVIGDATVAARGS